jgi:hypothetical protein
VQRNETQAEQTDRGAVLKIKPGELMRLAPRFRPRPFCSPTRCASAFLDVLGPLNDRLENKPTVDVFRSSPTP